MQLKIEREIDKDKFKTLISFENYGGADISAEYEEELLKKYPCLINYKDLTFSGKFNVRENKVITDNTTNGEIVNIALIDKVLPLTENFQAKYEINTNDILDNEVQTKLNTKELVAQAKILLFEEKIIEKIKELIDTIKFKNNNFKKVSPIHITL